MPTNEERFRFLAQFRLSVTWNNDSVSLMWRGTDRPGHPGQYRPIANAPTLEEAVDVAIARWERKYRKKYVPREQL
jgi:hypothetical protein